MVMGTWEAWIRTNIDDKSEIWRSPLMAFPYLCITSLSTISIYRGGLIALKRTVEQWFNC
jgi:hypothetical protein